MPDKLLAVVSIQGRDQKGVVAQFATFVAERGINIEEEQLHARYCTSCSGTLKPPVREGLRANEFTFRFKYFLSFQYGHFQFEIAAGFEANQTI